MESLDDAHNPLRRLLAANTKWALDVSTADPNFFSTSATRQSPHTLWIGCADSRAPESVITASRPGEIFVHRNIANQFHLDDKSVQAVLKYAVDFVGVKHVIIVGHSECGGVSACLGAAQSPSLGPIATIPSLPAESALNRWLEPLTRVAASLQLSSVPVAEALPIVVEENVKMQVENLASSETIRAAWRNPDKEVWIHGWVYDLKSGLLKDLDISRGPHSKSQ